MKKLALSAAIAGVVLAAASTAQAGAFRTNMVGGTLNTFEDQSREVIVDTNGDGFLGVGDMFVGFLSLDNRGAPSFEALNNDEMVLAFSFDVTSYDLMTGAITWGPGTTAGLTLSDLLGTPVTAGAMGAMYTDVGFDVLNENAVGDYNSDGQVDIFDYMARISGEGRYELIAGLNGDDDHFVGAVEVVTGGPLPLSVLLTAPQTLSLFSFHGGLTVLDNQAGVVFLEEVEDCEETPIVCLLGGNGSFHDITVTNGDGSSAVGFGQFNHLNNVSVAGTTGGTSYAFYGLTDNADVNVLPVPEPTTVALLGMGLLGAGVSRRAAKRK